MAGDIKRQRKSWTFQGSRGDRSCCFFLCRHCIDRSKVSINILRANLAEEGDEDAQLEVAKRLLQETTESETPEATQNENARLALYWLIKSSEQGNDEATTMLKQCLQSGRGLTAQNILDVRTCATTPKDEKLTFKAARLLYRKLSNGEEFITTTQLLARVNARRKNVTFENENGIEKGEIVSNQQKDLDQQQQHNVELENRLDATDAVPENGNPAPNVGLNETFIVSSQPQSTTSKPVKAEEIPSSENRFHKPHSKIAGTKPSDLHFAMTQSGKKLTLSDLLSVAKDFNLGSIPQLSVDERKRILSRHKWNSNSSFNMLMLQFFILAVMANAMRLREAVMWFVCLGILWASHNLFLWKLRYENFNDWSGAFNSVLKKGSWKTERFKKRLSLRYLLPYLIIIFVASLATGFQTPLSTFILGTIVLISVHFRVLGRKLPSWRQFIFLSIALIYHHAPVINLFGADFVERSQFLHEQMISNQQHIIYFPVPLNGFSLISITLLLTAIKYSVHGMIRETLPEVAFAIWLNKVVQACVVLEYEEISVGICIIATLCTIMFLASSQLKAWQILLFAVTALVVIISVGLVQSGKHLAGKDETKSEVKFLEWEEYDGNCHKKAWAVQSPASTQIKCTALYGDHKAPTVVKWKGRISIVKVEKLSRSLQDSSLLDVVFDISMGVFPSQKDDGTRNWQSYLPGSNDGETFAPTSIIVRTDELRDMKRKQYLIDHILNFRSGDKIEVIGKLKESTIGSLKPQIIEVQTLQCLSCATADYGEFAIAETERLDYGWSYGPFKFETDMSLYSINYTNFVIDIFASLRTLINV
ncbi:unnamed protein product [Orchesella dallaii]|uniref:Wolframin n=1 Tax=Orchesella dallaii TaxID=48710 RepID=A0ABP1PRP9_9HEXA